MLPTLSARKRYRPALRSACTHHIRHHRHQLLEPWSVKLQLSAGLAASEASRGDQQARSEIAKTARAIAEHLEAGKRFGPLVRFSKPGWAELIRTSRVSGQPPSEAAHFRALESLMTIDSLRGDLARRWDRQMASRGAPSADELGRRPEERAAHHATEIRSALSWHDECWSPCAARIEELGLDFDQLSRQSPRTDATSELAHLREVVRTALEPALEQRQRYIEWRKQRDRKSGWLLQL